ncbi:MAG: hypothetical protein NTY11_00390 [Candidatus Parcubacteria bacterium]|nr:hypothetical protein [Candidatus Parcubacteria bacterium]
MNAQSIYIVIAIVALAIIGGLMIFMKKMRPGAKLSPLAGLAFVFLIAGIIFGENRLIGYILIGIGLIIAIFDIIKKFKK